MTDTMNDQDCCAKDDPGSNEQQLDGLLARVEQLLRFPDEVLIRTEDLNDLRRAVIGGQPNLGLATNAELINELGARYEIGNVESDYSPVVGVVRGR